MMQESFAFGGWITPNFIMIPDQFFDEVMPHLSEAELRVLLYIMRRTFGFTKAQDNISLSQMVDGITAHDGQMLDGGCGLSKSAVAKGLKILLEKRIITATRNQSREKGSLPTTYRLLFASNCKQARNIYAALDLVEEVFVEQYVYQARQKTKHQTKVRSKWTRPSIMA
jgi:DNA-binding transcriptional ArsR family regulator